MGGGQNGEGGKWVEKRERDGKSLRHGEAERQRQRRPMR